MRCWPAYSGRGLSIFLTVLISVVKETALMDGCVQSGYVSRWHVTSLAQARPRVISGMGVDLGWHDSLEHLWVASCFQQCEHWFGCVIHARQCPNLPTRRQSAGRVQKCQWDLGGHCWPDAWALMDAQLFWSHLVAMLAGWVEESLRKH